MRNIWKQQKLPHNQKSPVCSSRPTPFLLPGLTLMMMALGSQRAHTCYREGSTLTSYKSQTNVEIAMFWDVLRCLLSFIYRWHVPNDKWCEKARFDNLQSNWQSTGGVWVCWDQRSKVHGLRAQTNLSLCIFKPFWNFSSWRFQSSSWMPSPMYRSKEIQQLYVHWCM